MPVYGAGRGDQEGDPVVPDEAVDKAAAVLAFEFDGPTGDVRQYRAAARMVLEPAAPAIVAANPPETKPADDLRETLDATLTRRFYTSKADLLTAIAPAVQAWVDTQVAAARDEVERLRAQHAAALALPPIGASDPDPLEYGYNAARRNFRRALGVED